MSHFMNDIITTSSLVVARGPVSYPSRSMVFLSMLEKMVTFL